MGSSGSPFRISATTSRYPSTLLGRPGRLGAVASSRGSSPSDSFAIRYTERFGTPVVSTIRFAVVPARLRTCTSRRFIMSHTLLSCLPAAPAAAWAWSVIVGRRYDAARVCQSFRNGACQSFRNRQA